MAIETTNEKNLDSGNIESSVVEHLSQVVKEYLEARPHFSLNGLSKKCGVSEPTLRRIVGQKIKTIPQSTTVLDILSFISGVDSIQSISKRYPGAIAEFLTDHFPVSENFDQEYSSALNAEFENPIKYLIFKLAGNDSGVRKEKIKELFGAHGIALFEEMIAKGFIDQVSPSHYRAKAKSFRTSNEIFTRNFKLMADYIKTSKHGQKKNLNPFFINKSNSINAKAYEKIVKIQRQAFAKIHQIMDEEGSQGELPVFFLSAIDTQDLKAAFEWDQD